MSPITGEEIKKLFSLSTADDVEQFLSQIYTQSSKWKWLPLGGRSNNSGSVNLAMDPGQALVERITNAMDANIELQYELAGRPDGLSSPRQAVQRLWNLPSSRLTRESSLMESFIDEMAPKNLLRVIGSRRRGHSSVIVQDAGIGQHPDDLPTTILGLQESNKIDKRYLMGAFGQGGSSTFAYCPYSLIVSRRHSRCLDGKTDLIGWTIVRKFDDDSWKTFRYEYLANPDGSIPRISPEELRTLNNQFEHGTKIIHFNYELGRLNALFSLVAYRFFENLLFDPVLPYRIEDHRVTPTFNRNLYGGRNRLESVDPSRRPEAQTFEADLSRWGGEGVVHIRYWVFRSGQPNQEGDERNGPVGLGSYLDYDNSPRTILFTLNGQRHHVRERSLIKEARLGALANYLLLHVDCDDMSLRLKKEIFTATRAGATIGEKREDLLISAVKEALADNWLKDKLNDILQRREAMITSESARRVNQMLTRLITVYRQERSTGGHRGRGQEGGGRDGSERQVHNPPRSLKFADHRRLELLSGEQTTIYLVTDGPDDLLIRRRRRGNLNLTIEGDNIASFSNGDMRNGRIPIHVAVPTSATLGQGGRVVASLGIEPDILLTDSREIKIIPPPPPYVGIDPPTKFDFAKNTLMTVEVGRKSASEIHTDARNDVVTRAINPARVQGSVNIPNVYISVRGPRDGIISLEVNTTPDANVDTEGLITANLILADGTTFSATRPIKLIAPQPHPPSPGVQVAPVPAYQLKRVWREVPTDVTDGVPWSEFDDYNADKVGHFEPNGDELWLYVNMDESQFHSERLLWGRRFGESTMARLMDRYVAYLAFHLFQIYEYQKRASAVNTQEPENGNGVTDADSIHAESHDSESPAFNHELRRVAATLIQTLRSEAELMRIENTDSDTEINTAS